jgi:hypothetical protein
MVGSNLAFSESLPQTGSNYEEYKGNQPSSRPKEDLHLITGFPSQTSGPSMLRPETDSISENIHVKLMPLAGPFELDNSQSQLSLSSRGSPITDPPSPHQASKPFPTSVPMSSDELLLSPFKGPPGIPIIQKSATSIGLPPQFSLNATSSLQLFCIDSVPNILVRLRHGHESYTLIRNLMRIPGDSIDLVLDTWFLDIYDALEDLLLGDSISHSYESILSRLEDGLIILKFFLKNQFSRFSSLKPRLFMLLFRLYHHSSPTIVCASEDLWSILFKNHEYSNHIFDFLKAQLKGASLSSTGEIPFQMTPSSILSSIWSLLALFARHISLDTLHDYVEQDLAAQFAWTIRHHRIEVRKSIVDFLVVCYYRLGTSFDEYVSELSVTERKLVQIYMDRK